jgi:hypothetical protein
MNYYLLLGSSITKSWIICIDVHKIRYIVCHLVLLENVHVDALVLFSFYRLDKHLLQG